MIKIYHNPRCGKSRECLAFLEEYDEELEIIKYLDTPLDHKTLTELIKKLNCRPIELIRTKELIWIDNYKNKTLSDYDIIQVMVDHPILIERPIVVRGKKAVIARPLEKINTLL